MSEVLSEAGHWYTSEGKPAYTQVVKTGANKGKDRPTTVRDARSLNLIPSVTTIMNVLDKPALTHWKISRAVAEARGEPVPANDAAEIGTLIHGAIEHWIETGEKLGKYASWCDTVEKVFKEVGVSSPVSERSFAFTRDTGTRYAGAVDLHDREAKVIIDFKTKDFTQGVGGTLDKNGKKVVKFHYDEHAMQLAAYGRGLGLISDSTRYYNLFLSRQQSDAVVLHQWDSKDIQRGEDMFNPLVEFFHASKKL